MEKKFFEEPSVQKVEFEFNERIAASGCQLASYTSDYYNARCKD